MDENLVSYRICCGGPEAILLLATISNPGQIDTARDNV